MDTKIKMIFNKELLNYISKIREIVIEKNVKIDFKKLLSNKDNINLIINNSMKDPCWRLFYQKKNID